MENRIKIGDEWYVKENSLQTDVQTPFLIKSEDILIGKYSLWEDNNFCFEGTHDLSTGVLEMIVFTDKRNQRYPFPKKQTWDNEVWFSSVIEGISDAFDEFNKKDTLLLEFTRAFIKEASHIHT